MFKLLYYGRIQTRATSFQNTSEALDENGFLLWGLILLKVFNYLLVFFCDLELSSPYYKADYDFP